MMKRIDLEIIKPGNLSYSDGLDLQNQLHQICVESGRFFIICLEHEPVITAGKHADEKDLYLAKEALKNQNIDFARTERGGKLTAHNPGQLVVYPILPLSKINIRTRTYVSILEQSIMKTFEEFNIKTHTDKSNPGVWFESDKIAAIGIRIKDRVSMHGIAMNINNDLDIFSLFLPCGIKDRGICNLHNIITDNIKKPTILDVCEIFLKVFLSLIFSDQDKNIINIVETPLEDLNLRS